MFWFVYITNPDRKTAANIGKRLVSKKLAACCNVLSITDSIYRWKGKSRNGREWALIVKTTKPDAVEKEIRKNHPYEVPCITRWKVSANREFERWVKSGTK